MEEKTLRFNPGPTDFLCKQKVEESRLSGGREIISSQKSSLRNLKVILLKSWTHLVQIPGRAWGYLGLVKKDPEGVIIDFLNELAWQTITLRWQCHSRSIYSQRQKIFTAPLKDTRKVKNILKKVIFCVLVIFTI